MPEPKDYKHIKAWGKMMGSFPYYIKEQQAKAAQENAPLDAIYKSHDAELEQPWRRHSQIQNENTREEIDRIILKMESEAERKRK